MQPFITFRDTDKDGKLQYYILQRDFPYYIGQIVTYPVEGAIICLPISKYSLWISFAGNIQGNLIHATSDFYNEIQPIFLNMTEWYLVNRILIDVKKFSKWKLPHQKTT